MLNAEQIKDVAEIAKAVVSELLVAEPIKRKFSSAAGEEADSKVEVISEGPERVMADPKGGFKHMAHFLHDVAQEKNASESLGQWQEAIRLIGKTAGYMEEGDLAQGGYLVPEEFKATLLKHQLEESIVMSRATVVPMSAPMTRIPCMVDSDHSSNFFGGITVYRKGEGAERTATNPTFGHVQLTLHELDGLCYVSNELLNDTPMSLQSVIQAQFTEAINFTMDDDFLNGTGANQALGAFNASNPSLVSVTKETAQTADTIVWKNIVKMWQQVHPRCRGRAIWLANCDCFEQLASMTMDVGTAGVPVFMPAGGASGKPYDTLMGRPLIFTEKMQTLGDAGDIGVADFSQYLIGQKSGGIQVAASMHVRFVYNEMAYRFILRVDGQPWWLSALTPKRGANDLSPFVRLAARA